MKLSSFGEKMAHINLSDQRVEIKPTPADWTRKYIGGRGLGVRYVLENGPGVEPLSPENVLCFVTGPLTGTEANMSGRWACVTKSPLTGTVADSHQGGWTAARLRWAGFDGLIFEERAESPVYVFIEDGEIAIRDAEDLWGKGVHETVALLRERYGENNLSVCAIGQAGEGQNRYASWISEDDRAFGRGGCGAVGGSKNLKAIVIRAGSRKSEVADDARWKEKRRQALNTIRDEKNITSPKKGGLSVFGTNVITNVTNAIGALPTNNSQLTSFGSEAELISGEYVHQNLLVGDPTCHACPVACKKEVEIKEGPYQGLRMESVEYESVWALGSNCGNSDIASIVKMIDQCNDYGMDTIELGNVLSVYMEATQRGWVQGEGLQWGDAAGMVALIDAIARRTGDGDILAEGTARAAAHFGHPEIAMVAKGQAIPAYDPRGMKGMGLAYATSNRGACHLRGYVAAAELGVIPIKADPLEWQGKGQLMKAFQDLLAFSDSLDLCKFSSFAETADEYAAQYGAAMGIEFGPDEALAAGERVYNLERYYNNLAGFGAGSDTLPERFTSEPSTLGGSVGHICELPEMLEEYYAARGWEQGVVPEAKLKELGIL